MDSIYRLEGARVHTSKFAAGPWSREMQHGFRKARPSGGPPKQ